MSAAIKEPNSATSGLESDVFDRFASASVSGRTIKVPMCSEDELLLSLKKIFELNAFSIDFTLDLSEITFGSTFETFVKGVKESKIVKKVILTKSKLMKSEEQSLDKLASARKGLVLVDSEGGFIGGVHTNWQLYYDTLYRDKALLVDKPELRRTPSEGFEIFKARYQRIPNSVIDVGAADGSNTLPLILLGCKNIKAVDISQSAAEGFARRLESLGLTAYAAENNIQYHICEFMDVEVDVPTEFYISNYVLSYRNKEDFEKFWKKSVESVADDGFLCGEFFGTPPSDPRQGITYHTFEQAIALLQTSNLEILYFEIEPHEVSLSERKDAETIPWGDLYRIAVRKSTAEVEPSSYEKVKQALIVGDTPSSERRIFNVLQEEAVGSS